MKLIHWLLLLLLTTSCSSHKLPVIVFSDKATSTEQFAAKELRRYIYLRTGSLPEIRTIDKIVDLNERYILVTSLHTNDLIQNQFKEVYDTSKILDPGDFYLYSSSTGLVIEGGSEIGTLYGVYQYLQEKLNIGFYLHGDVIPDGGVRNIDISGYNKIYRGLHNHTMNNDSVSSESPIEVINQVGKVNTSYPAKYSNTGLFSPGHQSKKTSDFSFGGDQIFANDDFTTTANDNWENPHEFADFRSTGNFYKHWCFVQFGISIANESAAIFNSIDEELPDAVEWYRGTGDIKLIQNTWEKESKKYGFVDQFENLLLPVKGKGNLDRFQYWLHKFKYHRTIAQLGCTLYQLNLTMDKVRTEKDPVKKKNLVTSEAFPIRSEITRLWGEATTYLLESISTSREMITFSNLENRHTSSFIKYDSIMVAIAGPLPQSASPSKEYKSKLRAFVPVVRTSRKPGEDLKLKVIILGWHDTSQSQLYWKPLGAMGDYKILPLKHVNRGVYEALLPAKEIGDTDFEYFINIIGKGESATFPVTAPEINQTIVVRSEK